MLHFQEGFRWHSYHDSYMKKAFDYRYGRRIQQMLGDLRKGKEETTQWLRPQLKRQLMQYWDTDPKFKHRQDMNKANRSSSKGGSLHCGGSATIASTKKRMVWNFDLSI